MKIAIISDIHEDFNSLTQAAYLIDQNKCDRIICLGDIVGFSVPFYNYFDTRNASACIEWVKNNCTIVLAGNHDLYAIKKIPRSKVRHFIYPADWYSLPFIERLAISQDKIWLYEDNELSALLNEKDVEYLSQLPEILITDIEGHKCLFSHYVYPDFTGSAKAFILEFNDIEKHIKFLKQHHCSFSFVGHMHAEGLLKLSGKNIEKYCFNKKVSTDKFNWFSIPSVSNSKNKNGFLIWDTKNNVIEALPLNKKFKLI